jgi:AcrR family transcriptional regulator
MGMPENRKTRAPQQKRSIEKRERIIEAAYSLFCSQGYANTTAPEVAAAATVAVGSFYAYFKDKHDLLMTVMDRYMASYDETRTKAFAILDDPGIPLQDALRSLIESLIEVHENSKAFNSELKALYYFDPEVAEHMRAQRKKVRSAITDFFAAKQEAYRIGDPAVMAFIVDSVIDAVVDKIVFEPEGIDRKILVETTVELLCGYFVD